MKIGFIWQGFSGVYGHWNDGLRQAMRLISETHEVRYYDTKEIDELMLFNPDVVLYWEAPCTYAGKDRMNYWAVQELPYKKALLFAGGPIQKEWCDGFDLFFVESRINEEEFEALGLPWKRAFGVNTDIFKPDPQQKVFGGMFQATCASWKRHWLLADALGGQAVICGRNQDSDTQGFVRARAAGALVLPELSYEAVAALINASHAVVNCSAFWGGGQRATLEAMACNVPVIAMSDSPKNREYVEESGAGLVVEPTPEAIREAVERIKADPTPYQTGAAYVASRWTAAHYAAAIIDGVSSL